MIYNDLPSFAIIYVVSITGFGIAFFSLFSSISDDGGFKEFTTKETFLTLFLATLFNFENFDLTEYDNTYTGYIGIALMIFFVIFTGIILINLLIARMSSTHGAVESVAIDEWAYIKV